MDFTNSPHLMTPLGMLLISLKSKLLWLLSFIGFGLAVGPNNEIDLPTRIANLELAVFGGPNVNSPFTPTLFSGSADAINFPNQFIFVTTAGTDAMTLAAPVAGTDDFKKVRVFSTTAYAHTITTPANKIVGGGSSGDTLTFAAHAGAMCELMAYQGLWQIMNLQNVTLSEV